MGDEKHGRPVGAPERRDQLLGLETGEGIERRERLVEQQQLRLAHQGAGQGCALGFAAGQRQGPSLEAMPQANLGQGGNRLLPRVSRAQPERHIGPDALPGDQAAAPETPPPVPRAR